MRCSWKSEDGSSLMIIIIFVLVFSVVIGAILEFSSTGLRSSSSITDLRDQDHAVDGAIDGAINAIRGSSSAGINGGTCPTFEYTPTGANDPQHVTVTCAGVGSFTGASSDNQPEYAVMALAEAARSNANACSGFIMNGNNTMTIDGGIFSNGRIAVGDGGSSSCGSLSGTGTISVFGDGMSVRPCSWWSSGSDSSAKMKVTGGQRGCPAGSASPVPATGDGMAPSSREGIPSYPANASSVNGVLALARSAYVSVAGSPGSNPEDYVDPTPRCTSNPTGIDVTFWPGVYTETPDRLVDQTPGCTGDTLWFRSGTYYFDFPAGRSTWNIDPDNVIGGELKASWSLPDACDAGSESDMDKGVQFIFGGASQFATKGNNASSSDTGVINLCAGAPTVSGTKQRMAVYGLCSESGSACHASSSASSPVVVDLENKGPLTSDPLTCVWTNLQNAKEADGNTASLTISANQDCSIVYDDFEDVPNGSKITGVTAEIRHKEPNNLKWSVDLTDAAGDNLPDGGNPDCSDSGGPGGITITTCDLLADFSKPPVWKSVNSLAARLTFEENGPVEVDDVRILVTYETRSEFRALTCTAVSNCDFLTTTTNPYALFRGTFFAPSARIAINVHNGGQTEFNRGVVVDTITGQASSSTKQTTAPFQLPGLAAKRRVVFEARVCQSASSCPTSTSVRVRALVEFDDTKTASGGTLPGRFIHIKNWAVLRP
jgi:hypothetical protein